MYLTWTVVHLKMFDKIRVITLDFTGPYVFLISPSKGEPRGHEGSCVAGQSSKSVLKAHPEEGP